MTRVASEGRLLHRCSYPPSPAAAPCLAAPAPGRRRGEVTADRERGRAGLLEAGHAASHAGDAAPADDSETAARGPAAARVPPPPQDPGSAAALCNYGLLLQTVKPDLPRARDLYARALKANPSDPDARGATRMGGE